MAADLSLKSIFCNFLISSALVSLARAEDNVEEQLQRYLCLRRSIAQADGEVQNRLESKTLDEVSSTDLVGKLALLLAFDFEAAVALKQWRELSEIVLKASACQNLECFKMMADCILQAHAPPEGKARLVSDYIGADFPIRAVQHPPQDHQRDLGFRRLGSSSACQIYEMPFPDDCGL